MKLLLGYRKYNIPGIEDVTVEIRPLESKDYQTLLRFTGRASKVADSDDETQSVLQMGDAEIIEMAKEFFPRYLRNLKGIEAEDENGSTRDATVEDLWTFGSCLPVCFGILMQMLTMSNLTKTEADTLKKEQPEPLQPNVSSDLTTPLEESA